VQVIIEDLRVKQGVMQQLDRLFATQPDVVFCSNTINFSIDAITATMEHHRGRVVGVRFLHPVYYIPLVEVSLGRDFSSTRAFLNVWHALKRLGYAPFLFHHAPDAIRMKLDADRVQSFLSSDVSSTLRPRPAATAVADSLLSSRCRPQVCVPAELVEEQGSA
jgi:hypothetical protein